MNDNIPNFSRRKSKIPCFNKLKTRYSTISSNYISPFMNTIEENALEELSPTTKISNAKKKNIINIEKSENENDQSSKYLILFFFFKVLFILY